MKVPVVQGRDFDERDREGAPCVAVINEAFGEKYFPAGCARKTPHKRGGGQVRRKKCRARSSA
jgi:hypothetical protein